MKQTFLAAVLFSACLWSCQQVSADVLKRLEIIVTNGNTQELDDVDLAYSDEKKNVMEGYFQIYPEAATHTCLWVDLSKVKTATFREGGSDILCTMELENGKEVFGRFHDPGLRITGKNELGKTSLDLSKIRSMRFTGFQTYVDGKLVEIDRKQYSKEKLRRNEQPPKRWIVTEGTGKKDVQGGIYLWDSYNTDYDGWDNIFGLQRIDGSLLRYAKLGTDFRIVFGIGETSVNFDDLDSFETSGNLLDANPEIIILKGGKESIR